MAKTDEEVDFDLDTAPEFVHAALKLSNELVTGAGAEKPVAARLMVTLASAMHPAVGIWLAKAGYMPVEMVNAIGVSVLTVCQLVEESDL